MILDPGFDRVISVQLDHTIAIFAFNLRFTYTIMDRKDWVDPTNRFSLKVVYSGLQMDQQLKGKKVQGSMV